MAVLEESVLFIAGCYKPTAGSNPSAFVAGLDESTADLQWEREYTGGADGHTFYHMEATSTEIFLSMSKLHAEDYEWGHSETAWIFKISHTLTAYTSTDWQKEVSHSGYEAMLALSYYSAGSILYAVMTDKTASSD
jgi:hypothetical protein